MVDVLTLVLKQTGLQGKNVTSKYVSIASLVNTYMYAETYRSVAEWLKTWGW